MIDRAMAHRMKRAFLYGFLMAPIVMAPMGLMANTSLLTETNQGMEYAQSDDVSIDKEELIISKEKVDVSYTFYNHSDKTITSKAIFPLPSIPHNGKVVPERMALVSAVDPLWGPYQVIEEATRELAPGQERFVENGAVPLHTRLNWTTSYPQTGRWYSDQERRALVSMGKTNSEAIGAEWRPTLRYRAVDKTGKDITKILQQHNIPVSAIAVFGAFDHVGTVENDPELVKRLQKLDLIDIKHKAHPQWSNQISYVWQETFPAQKPLEVKHSYTPFLGYGEQSSEEFLKGLKPIDGDMKTFEETEDKRKKGCFYTELKYVLATGGNWKGGVIKDFTITIKKPHSFEQLATNFPGSLKVLPNGDYQCHISGFKPPQEPLRLVWFASATSEPLFKNTDKTLADKASEESGATNEEEADNTETTDPKNYAKNASVDDKTETSEKSKKD